jgi:hypothetical protein
MATGLGNRKLSSNEACLFFFACRWRQARCFSGMQLGEALVPADAHSTANGSSVIVVLFCVLLIFGSAFVSDVRWTIRPNEIQIERKRGIGRSRLEVVKRADITDITIFKEGTEHGLRVWLLLHRSSKASIESPAARFGTEPDRPENRDRDKIAHSAVDQAHLVGYGRSALLRIPAT